MSIFIWLAALTSCKVPEDSVSGQTSFSSGADLGKYVTDANYTQAATGSEKTGVTSYKSSNTAVATVVPSTGEVNILTPGTTTITASNFGDSH